MKLKQTAKINLDTDDHYHADTLRMRETRKNKKN